jgi:hypothetical protein
MQCAYSEWMLVLASALTFGKRMKGYSFRCRSNQGYLSINPDRQSRDIR